MVGFFILGGCCIDCIYVVVVFGFDLGSGDCEV